MDKVCQTGDRRRYNELTEIAPQHGHSIVSGKLPVPARIGHGEIVPATKFCVCFGHVLQTQRCRNSMTPKRALSERTKSKCRAIFIRAPKSNERVVHRKCGCRVRDRLAFCASRP